MYLVVLYCLLMYYIYSWNHINIIKLSNILFLITLSWYHELLIHLFLLPLLPWLHYQNPLLTPTNDGDHIKLSSRKASNQNHIFHSTLFGTPYFIYQEMPLIYFFFSKPLTWRNKPFSISRSLPTMCYHIRNSLQNHYGET